MNAKKSAPQPGIKHKEYSERLRGLQIELVKLQRHLIDSGGKVLMLFEGRDTAGKDGTIKRVVEHLSPRETRVVALGKPTDGERSAWYFQRWVAHLPTAREFVCFNRSWYNRAGVERVMGFATPAEIDEFFESVPFFEQMLVRSGIQLFKYYLDISKKEQKARLDARRDDPLKQWKISEIDNAALQFWKQYGEARNEMLARTHNAIAPWTVVLADDKRLTRLNVIRDLLTRVEYPGKKPPDALPDPNQVFLYERSYVEQGILAS